MTLTPEAVRPEAVEGLPGQPGGLLAAGVRGLHRVGRQVLHHPGQVAVTHEGVRTKVPVGWRGNTLELYVSK